jgi:hypothetical protein
VLPGDFEFDNCWPDVFDPLREALEEGDPCRGSRLSLSGGDDESDFFGDFGNLFDDDVGVADAARVEDANLLLVAGPLVVDGWTHDDDDETTRSLAKVFHGTGWSWHFRRWWMKMVREMSKSSPARFSHPKPSRLSSGTSVVAGSRPPRRWGPPAERRPSFE